MRIHEVLEMVLMAILSRVLCLIWSEVQKTQYSGQFLFSFKTLKDPRKPLDYNQKLFLKRFFFVAWADLKPSTIPLLQFAGITGGRHFYLAFVALIPSTLSPLLWMFETGSSVAYAVLWLAAVAQACPELLLLLIAFFIGWAHSLSPYPQGTNL